MSDPFEHLRGLRPGPPLEGCLRAPGSKSLAQRALVCAALARGRTHIVGLPDGADVQVALEWVRACGAGVERHADGSVAVEGRAAALAPRAALELGESGTLARLALAALALGCEPGTRLELRAAGSLARRSSPALVTALESVGVEFTSRSFPWGLRAGAPPRELTLADPGSSQELSGLLIALAAHAGERSVRVRGALPSRPYAEMTRAVLQLFGVRCDTRELSEGSLWSVRGPLQAPREVLELEPDASSAAVALAAGCLSGGSVLALGLTPAALQGDVRMAEHLAAFGCRTQWCEEGLRATGGPTQPADLDLCGQPDLAPVLAVIAAAAAPARARGEFWSRLSGLETLPGKESSRLEVLAAGLQAAGWACSVAPGELRVGQRVSEASPACTLDAHGDHRMAFAFALLGLVRPGLRVQGAQAVAKSWPSFWDDLAALGARASE